MDRLLNQVSVFQYVTAPNAPTYRAIMQALYDAKRRYVIELRTTEIFDGIRRGGFYTELDGLDALDRHLESLVGWGNIDRRHDTASVARLEEYKQKRYLYHLTAVGEAAHRAVLDVEATLGKSGSLQTNMLVRIRDCLRTLATMDTPPLAADVTVRVLHDLHAAFDTLTQEANRFIGDLNQQVRGERMEEDRFVNYKRAILSYISRFIDQLRTLATDITATVDHLSIGDTIATLIRNAVSAADLPPAVDAVDPEAGWIADQLDRWTGIRLWFVGDASSAPTVDRLAEVAVGAVVSLTRTLGRLNDRRMRPVDRAADFRTLARWFSECPDDNAAHALWQTTFGGHSARHFCLEHNDVDAVDPSTSWWSAPPVEIPIRLRTHGSVSHAGRASAVPDRSAERQWIAQRAQREREQIERALQRFRDRGSLTISGIATLDEVEFDLFLLLIDEALTGMRLADGTLEAETADGRLVIRLSKPVDGEVATLQTPRGRLTSLNYTIVIASTMSTTATTRTPADSEEIA